MNEPRLTEKAEADLEGIWAYVARNNPTAADSLIESILAQCRAKVQFPETGRLREDLAPHLRSFVVKPYVIFFRPISGSIEVLRIIHGSRDIDRIIRVEGLE